MLAVFDGRGVVSGWRLNVCVDVGVCVLTGGGRNVVCVCVRSVARGGRERAMSM